MGRTAAGLAAEYGDEHQAKGRRRFRHHIRDLDFRGFAGCRAVRALAIGLPMRGRGVIAIFLVALTAIGRVARTVGPAVRILFPPARSLVRTRPRSAAELPTSEPTQIELCFGFKTGPNAGLSGFGVQPTLHVCVGNSTDPNSVNAYRAIRRASPNSGRAVCVTWIGQSAGI
jgi:hypothetical protein